MQKSSVTYYIFLKTKNVFLRREKIIDVFWASKLNTSTITLLLFQEYWDLRQMAFKLIDLGNLFYKYGQFDDLIASQKISWLIIIKLSLIGSEIISLGVENHCQKWIERKKKLYNWKIHPKLIDIVLITWWILHLLDPSLLANTFNRAFDSW